MTIHKVILPQQTVAEPAAPAPSERPVMPPEIAAAVCVVMAQVKPLAKDSKNAFQKYDYVSVDQFYALVGRLMAEAGIFTVLYEKSMDVGERKTSNDRGETKVSVWLTAVYDVWIYHTSGAAFGPVTRSITVPASGAQSYASAVSFVEKYYLRSLLKIPTGEADDDAAPRRDLPANGREVSRDRNLNDEAADIAGSKAMFVRDAERHWSTLKSQDDMGVWWKANAAAMSDIFDGKDDPVYIAFKDKYTARGRALAKPAPAADAPSSPAAGG